MLSSVTKGKKKNFPGRSWKSEKRGRKPCIASKPQNIKSKKKMNIQGLFWNCRGLKKVFPLI